MKALLWLLRALVFVALFGLAVKNDGVVELRFYFDHSWQVPLSLVVLGTFAAGAAVGLTAALAALAKQWRELRRTRASESRGDAA
jgi:uncharacterized integral membrane protein